VKLALKNSGLDIDPNNPNSTFANILTQAVTTGLSTAFGGGGSPAAVSATNVSTSLQPKADPNKPNIITGNKPSDRGTTPADGTTTLATSSDGAKP
jgi:hypothetical protein